LTLLTQYQPKEVTQVQIINDEQHLDRLRGQRAQLRQAWGAVNGLPLSADEKKQMKAEIERRGASVAMQIRECEAVARKKIGELAEDNPAPIIGTLAILLNTAQGQLNIGKPMSMEQLEYTATDIITTYKHALTIDDIVICVKQGIRGYYGIVYDKLDAAVIHDWLAKYNAERKRIIHERNHNNYINHASETREPKKSRPENRADALLMKHAVANYARVQEAKEFLKQENQ
jgi:hypothetical protein